MKKTTKELNILSKQIEDKIMKLSSRIHLKDNLSIIKATIALHQVYDFKKDRLVFDNPYNALAHKILTGREQLISESPRIDSNESSQDVKTTNVSGDGLSTCLELISHKYINKDKNNIACVVGLDDFFKEDFQEKMHMINNNKNKIQVIVHNQERRISPELYASLNAEFRNFEIWRVEDSMKEITSIIRDGKYLAKPNIIFIDTEVVYEAKQWNIEEINKVEQYVKANECIFLNTTTHEFQLDKSVERRTYNTKKITGFVNSDYKKVILCDSDTFNDVTHQLRISKMKNTLTVFFAHKSVSRNPLLALHLVCDFYDSIVLTPASKQEYDDCLKLSLKTKSNVIIFVQNDMWDNKKHISNTPLEWTWIKQRNHDSVVLCEGSLTENLKGGKYDVVSMSSFNPLDNEMVKTLEGYKNIFVAESYSGFNYSKKINLNTTDVHPLLIDGELNRTEIIEKYGLDPKTMEKRSKNGKS